MVVYIYFLFKIRKQIFHFENNAIRFGYNNYLSKVLTWLDLCDSNEIVPMKSTPDESKRTYYRNSRFKGVTGGTRATALDEQNIYNFIDMMICII